MPSSGHFSSLWPFLHIFSNKKRHRRKTEELLQQKSDEILKARKIIDGFHNSGHDSWVLYNLRSQCAYFCIFLHFVCWLAATLRQNSWNYVFLFIDQLQRDLPFTFWPYQLHVNMRSQYPLLRPGMAGPSQTSVDRPLDHWPHRRPPTGEPSGSWGRPQHWSSAMFVWERYGTNGEEDWWYWWYCWQMRSYDPQAASLLSIFVVIHRFPKRIHLFHGWLLGGNYSNGFPLLSWLPSELRRHTH